MIATLRRLRWWDLDRVLILERALFPRDPWSAETFWAELAHPDTRHYVVAEDGGEIAGYAGLLVVGGDGDVQTLAVAPEHQGRGLGGGLLTALLEEADRRGCRDVLLEVRADNERAQGLYRRHGFERIALRRAYYPDGTDALVMRRRSGRSGRSA